MKKIKTLLMMALVVVSAVSCDFKDIDEGGMGNLKVGFDFSRLETAPKAMKVIFYPVVGNAVDMIKQGYTTMDWTAGNKTITLPSGVYNMTAFSIDGDHVFYTGETRRETLRLLTDEYNFGDATRAAKTPKQVVDSIYGGQDLRFTPEFVARANGNLIYVDEFLVEQEMVFEADSLTRTLNLNIKGVEGLQFVTECEGVIGGLSKYGNPIPEGTEADSTVMGFPMTVNAEQKTITASMQVWDFNPEENSDIQHKLTMFFWMDDAKVFVTVDITEAMRKAYLAGGTVNLDLTLDMNVRESVGSSGGFDINLDPWEDVEIDVGM